MSINFLGVKQTPLNQARFVVLPLPYDVTTSYIKGTARGPKAIIDASTQLEFFDEELHQESCIRNPIHTLPVPPLDFQSKADKLIPALGGYMKTLVGKLSRGQTLISLGGEHSLSYPIVNAYQSIYKDLSVLHLDAHSDLRDSYGGTKYSHACVMKRIYDSNVKSIVQVGIRNLTADCMKLINAQSLSRQRRDSTPGVYTERSECALRPKLSTHFAHTQPDYKKLGKSILSGLSDHVYVTIDLDVFDPSVMPAVGTPEPGGLNWYQVLDVLRPVFRSKKVVAFDVVELCPIKGSIHADFTAAKLIYRLIGYLVK
ncbi:MAG: agmatinase family protein [Planctomycetes bacterium]|nr:agmatinase family protein [Planctomycetota bacterium]